MAIVKFERTKHGRISVPGPVSMEAAKLYASMAVAAEEFDDQSDSDNFFECGEPTVIPNTMDGKCFGGPFVLDNRSVSIGDTGSENELVTIDYEATQSCVYFAKNTQFDRSVCLASIMSALGKVENVVKDNSQPGCWTLQVPSEMPISVIAECFGHQQAVYVKDREALMKSVCG